MWEETERLKEVVSVASIAEYEGTSVKLKENQRGATLTEIWITGISGEGITLKPDHGTDQFFKKGHGNQRCDYLILSEFQERKYWVFIDLKSKFKNYNDDEISSQLKASTCFFKFVNEVLKEFDQCNVLQPYMDGSQFRYVILTLPPENKLSEPIPLTRPKPNTSPDTPLILYVENGDSLDFKQLFVG